MEKRKSLLSPEQEKLLSKFQNNLGDKSASLGNNQNVNKKANSNGMKPNIRRSGSRGK
jgi:hypothetical protein